MNRAARQTVFSFSVPSMVKALSSHPDPCRMDTKHYR